MYVTFKSHIQTYFSKIICCLWDVFPHIIHGPIWTALSGCQSGITFVNVVSVFFNLDTHIHLKSKPSWWSENNKYTYFTRKQVKNIIKTQILFMFMQFVWNSLWQPWVLPNSISHNLFSAALWYSVSHYLLFLPFNVISVSLPTQDRACTRICIIY